jgi:N utilization substance protein B
MAAKNPSDPAAHAVPDSPSSAVAAPSRRLGRLKAPTALPVNAGEAMPLPAANAVNADAAMPLPAAPGAPPRARRSERYHTRALALQGLYGWLLAGGEAGAIGTQLLTTEQLAKVDADFFREILAGTIAAAPQLREEFAPLLDRPVPALSPVEHAVLLMGTYELKHRPEIPYRVSINEAIELAKSFGGTDGFRYVNGVLDKLAARLRSVEIESSGGGDGRRRA